MTQDKSPFSERQQAAFEALERQEREEAAKNSGAKPALPPAPTPPAPANPVPVQTAAAARPSPAGKPESPVGILMVGFVLASIGGAILISSVAGGWGAPTGAILSLIGGIMMTSAVIAIGVRWGMGLHDWDQQH